MTRKKRRSIPGINKALTANQGTQEKIKILRNCTMISTLPVWLPPKDRTVASALLSDGFEFIGLLENVETPDYLELVTGNWSLGAICSVNELVAICDGAVFSLDCDGESLLELRWNNTKKLIRSTLRNYQPKLNHQQLTLFAA